MSGLLLAVALGLGLAAAAGFRVFVPLLALGVAGKLGYLHLADSFTWLSSAPALLALVVATVLEVLAYYVPWLDHALDVVATPAALVAGAVSAAAVLGDASPMVRWLVPIIGGTGMAGMVQGATVLARIKSTALTGGLANPVISTVELVGAVATVLLAIFLPIAALLLLGAGCFLMFRASGRILFGRRRAV